MPETGIVGLVFYCPGKEFLGDKRKRTVRRNKNERD